MNKLTHLIKHLAFVIGLTLLPHQYCHAAKWWQISGAYLCAVASTMISSKNVQEPLAKCQTTLLTSVSVEDGISGDTGSPIPFITGPENLRLCLEKTDSCLAKTSLSKANYVPLKTDNQKTTSLIGAANELGESVNSLTFASKKSGITPLARQKLSLVIRNSLRKFADKLSDVEEIIITQEDIDSFQKNTMANGLPDFEVNILAKAGLSDDEISSIAKAVANMKVKLSVSSVTLRDVLYDTAASIILTDSNGSTQSGIDQCKADPASCGIKLVDTNGSTQVGIDKCKANPESCGILLTDINGSTQVGIDQCKANPISGEIITTPATLSANFYLHIPVIKYTPVTGSPVIFWADLSLAPTQNGLMFNVNDYGVNTTTITNEYEHVVPTPTDCDEMSMDNVSEIRNVNDDWNDFFTSHLSLNYGPLISFNHQKNNFKTDYCESHPSPFQIMTNSPCDFEVIPEPIVTGTVVDYTASETNPAKIRYSGCEPRINFEPDL